MVKVIYDFVPFCERNSDTTQKKSVVLQVWFMIEIKKVLQWTKDI